MKSLVLTIAFCFCLTTITHAQSFAALSGGLTIDINNHPPFYAIPIGIRWEPFRSSAFFMEVIEEPGIKKMKQGDAYTLNPQLEEHVTFREQIVYNGQSIGLGGSFAMFTQSNKQLRTSFSFGISHQNYRVKYQNYDHENYEVLNPDVGNEDTGLYVAVAELYNFHGLQRDMFISVRLQSPALNFTIHRYQVSYGQTASLQISFGYKFFYNKSSR